MHFYSLVFFALHFALKCSLFSLFTRALVSFVCMNKVKMQKIKIEMKPKVYSVHLHLDLCVQFQHKKRKREGESKKKGWNALFLLSGIFIKSKDCLWSLLVIEKWIKTFCKFKYQTTVIYWAIKKALRLIHQQSILKWDHNPFFAALSHSISIHTTIENSFYVLWMPAVSKHEARIPRTGQ